MCVIFLMIIKNNKMIKIKKMSNKTKQLNLKK